MMTDTKDAICRVMAEKMFDQLDSIPVGDETPELLATIIRDHTIVPEMVEFLRYLANYPQYVKEAEELLAKAEGRK